MAYSKIWKALTAAVLFTAATMFWSAPASAQATRTWVSGVGDDVNPCSRTAPCKTFAGAISKTAAGGEINCLDPGGFGAVTIVKSMTISCPYTEGGTLAGGNGIVVNLPLATDMVVIRGLDIFGVNPPVNGIRMVNRGTLHVEDTVIRRFNAANSQGISFQPSGAAELYVTNTTITENGSGASGGGILIQPTGAGSGKAILRDVRVHNNANVGIRVDSTGNAGTGNAVSIHGGQIAGNGTGLSVVAPAGTSVTDVMVVDATIVSNAGAGISANGSSVFMAVGNTTINTNGLGLSIAGAASVSSYGDNRLDGNPGGNGAFTAILPKK